MKKILVLFALLMTGVMGIHAQEGLKWGAMAGMNSSKFSTNGFDSKVGFHVGIKAEKDLPQIAQGVYLDMAALLSLKGMPEMDGLELCSTIKNDIRYSHIPIILLTAKASEEHQLEGLSVGADDYITKPFNMEVLKLRINKIIEMNVKRQEIFNQDIKIEPSRITITPLDQQLVEKAIQIVEDNISETEFSVEELASSLNISRSYFYKKMIKITGKKPIEFIRTIRMKRAQQLLTESQMQVSEIAYTLGYNSPKIFSKHFKEEFNISPSEFIRQQAE